MATGVSVLPDPASDEGRRFRERLRTDAVAWLTVVDGEGMPQPALVAFLWREDTEEVVIYSDAAARRLAWITRSDRVSVHLNDDGQGLDYLVLTGTLRRAGPECPGADENVDFLAKYGPMLREAFGSAAGYAQRFSVPLVFTPRGARGRLTM